jgi:hypothetical protein
MRGQNGRVLDKRAVGMARICREDFYLKTARAQGIAVLSVLRKSQCRIRVAAADRACDARTEVF